MIKKELQDAINDQINFEFYSAHIYLAMSGYCADMGLEGCENWFLVQYEEEVFHARKFMKYLNERGGRVHITGFKNPENDFKSVIKVFEDSLEHEQEVTERINKIAELADELKDYATRSFIQWYVDEQVEEEDAVSNIINKLKLVKDHGLYMLDKELGARVFTPPTE